MVNRAEWVKERLKVFVAREKKNFPDKQTVWELSKKELKDYKLDADDYERILGWLCNKLDM